MEKLIAANWKENPATETAALKLFDAVAGGESGKINRVGAEAEVVICPPFVYLEEVAVAFKKIRAKNGTRNLALGAQDVFWEESGAFTGAAGPKMLKSIGVQYVIVGHSERRKWFKETDEMVKKKIKIALKDGLRVILCVGESVAVRKKGMAAAKAFIKNQLKKGLAGIGKNVGAKAIVVAYEPIWAIGSGKNDNPKDAAAMAVFIKKTLKSELKIGSAIRFLYGGSVTSKNIADYVQYKSIDGALVGGASLKAVEFKKIINQVG